jgi:galactose-1-phosphate uridylyltransferase
MSELRKDPIVDRWVIVSPERSQRPSDVHLQPGMQPSSVCPFCPGPEKMPPNAVLAYRHNHTMPNTSGWMVRVVPNTYPALGLDGALGESVGGLFGAMNLVLQKVLRRSYLLLNDPAYNLVLQSTPWCDAHKRSYHWRLEIMPRLTGAADFEWAAGVFINTILPDEAACALRGVSEEGDD